MVVGRLGKIGNVRVKVIDKQKKRVLRAPSKPVKDVSINLLRVFPFEIVKAAEALVSRLDQSRSQQRAGQIVPEGTADINISVKPARNAPALLAIIEI